MKRRAVSRQALSVSLFPFLAVLICTMGVIIVMLVIVVRQATARAAQEIAQADLPPVKKEVDAAALREAEQKHAEALEDLTWQGDVLKQKRDERLADLTKIRQHLAHVEDHLRRLQQQGRELLERAQAIDEGEKLDQAQLQAARNELSQKQAEIAAAQEEVAKLKQQHAQEQRWYALLPYDGPNGTRRRPVYIECTEAGIILQPEGLALMPDDFNGPLGPGNPLDAALKAKREYLERNGERGLPYPLLIVRPDGIVAYMVARSALKSWDEEFGYELIDNHKRLAFGEPDPHLTQTLAQTVRQARQRQVMMAAAMPRKYQAEDSLNSFNSSDIISQLPETQLTRGVGNAPGSGGVGSGGFGQGGIGSGQGANFSQATGTSGSGGSRQNSQFAGVGEQTPNMLRPSSGNTGYGSADSAPINGSAGQGAVGGTAATGSATASSAGNPAASGGSGAGASWNGSGGTQIGSAGSFASSSGAASTSGGSSSTNSSGTSAAAGQTSSFSRQGHNWGLLNTQGRTVAVSRPIRIQCQADRIVVLPDIGDSTSPITIPVRQSQLTEQEVGAFVKTVQGKIEDWGIAAQNGYWRPQLSVDVTSSGEFRYQQWEQALAGSGYEIVRKQR